MANQREFFRLKLSVPFAFNVVKSGNTKIPRGKTFKYHTQDLGGGGLGFETDLALKAGDRLDLNLLLPNSSPVEARARVVWCKRVKDTDEEMYVGGLEFVEIDENAQDQVIGFMFRSQIEARKRIRSQPLPQPLEFPAPDED